MPQIVKRNLSHILLFGPLMVVALALVIVLMTPDRGMAQAKVDFADPKGLSNDTILTHVSLTQVLDSGGIAGERFIDAPGMQAFYEERGHKANWMDGWGRYPHKAKRIVQVLEDSWTHGLNPAHYHVEEIKQRLNNPIAANYAELELLLSDAIIRYGRDLSGMRVNPESIKQESKFWRQPLLGIDILRTVSETSDVRRGLKKLEPKDKLYRALRKELQEVIDEPEVGYIDILPIKLNGLLRPGDGHKSVALFRQRMGLKNEDAPNGKYYYDDILAEKIMTFQAENGLEPDGTIGTKTVDMLNRTKQDRIHQIIANLERLRWLEPEKPDRYILVNIPSQTLWAVDNGRVKIEMPVIVGSQWRKTRSFKTEITGVRFNPDWTIPPTIKQVDYLPKLREDPGYLAENDIELIRGYGRNAVTLDPYDIDWDKIGWRELNTMRFVMAPGPDNPLGKVRILMENRYNMYLHDTNKPEYFEKNDRTLSSGCIRMKDPQKIANFILQDNEAWDPKITKAFIRAGDTSDVDTETPMPVYILYQTVWQDDRGRVVFGPDVYRKDRKLISALNDMDGFVLPPTSEETVVSKAQDPLAASIMTP